MKQRFCKIFPFCKEVNSLENFTVSQLGSNRQLVTQHEILQRISKQAFRRLFAERKIAFCELPNGHFMQASCRHNVGFVQALCRLAKASIPLLIVLFSKNMQACRLFAEIEKFFSTKTSYCMRHFYETYNSMEAKSCFTIPLAKQYSEHRVPFRIKERFRHP